MKKHIGKQTIQFENPPSVKSYYAIVSKKESDGGTLNPASAAPAPLKRNDDTVDALRYMLYSYQCQNGGLAPWDAKRSYEHDWAKGVWGGR